MRSVVVQNYTWWQRSVARLRDAVPRGVAAFFAGPYRIARLGRRTARWEKSGSRIRPIEIEVGPDLLIETRIRLSRAPVRELRSAIALWLTTETPFESGELCVLVRPLSLGEKDEQGLFYLAAFPQRAFAEGLAHLGVPQRHVERVSILGRYQESSIPLNRSVSLWKGLRWVTPLVIFIASTVLASQVVCDRLNRQAALFDQDAQATVRKIADLQTTVERNKVSRKRDDAIRAEFSASSPTAMISFLRSSLPNDVEVLRLRIENGDVLVDVRTANALTLARSLSVPQGWQVTVSGGIVADPSTGQDVATLELKQSL